MVVFTPVLNFPQVQVCREETQGKEKVRCVGIPHPAQAGRPWRGMRLRMCTLPLARYHSKACAQRQAVQPVSPSTTAMDQEFSLFNTDPGPQNCPPVGHRCTLFKVCSWGFSLTACHSQLCSPPWHVMGSQCLRTLTTVALIPQTACFRQKKGGWRRLPSSHRESWDGASEVLVLGPGALGAC